MGNSAGVKDQRRRTTEINKQINRDRLASKEIRLILLGSGESGKSTLLRQMKLLKAGGYTEVERAYFRDHVCFNLAEWAVALGRALVEASVRDDLVEAVSSVESWVKVHRSSIVFDEEVKQSIRAIIRSPKDEIRSNAMLHLPDSAEYFFEKADDVMAGDFLPTGEDIVRCRIETVGVYELKFSVRGLPFSIIDVGGQRGQRKKWIHFFEGINGIVFVTALADYNQNLREDSQVNRMADSIDLWEKIVNHPIFIKTPILVFFNKNDKFEDKLRLVPLTVCFPQYGISTTGDSVDFEVFESARQYIKARFMERRGNNQTVYTHFTTATDQKNVDDVMWVTLDIIINENAKTSGLA